ncbi:MAG: acyl-CoA thioesterase [Proteobacteria bacterium]|nr:acyl-CoA thioesterase [Pseudomonadota bacterium]
MTQHPSLKSRDLSMTVLMTPDMVNFSGNVHGGAMLKLLDQVAYACAVRYSGRYAVTLAVEKVLFKQPVHVGELATFLARINHVGRTSMEVGIKVVTENPRDGRATAAPRCRVCRPAHWGGIGQWYRQGAACRRRAVATRRLW